MDDEFAIKVNNVSKIFKLPREKTTSVKSAVVNFYKHKRSFEEQQALKDVTFAVKKGEFFGIVGRNGSGKSTLLKMLAGIYLPTAGEIHINGKLTPFIELGVGFNMELTGRENIFLNGSLLGFNRKEMQAMYKNIVEFAELERFMDQKLKNYSSGMQVRLAFSIAIRAKSDILLVDEVLAVGDASFQQKCFDVFAELKKNGTTIVLVTHDMNSVLRFCDRAMLINKAKIINIGKPSTIADAYLALNYENSEATRVNQIKTAENKTKPTIESIKILDSKGNSLSEFPPYTEIKAQINYNNPKRLPIHFGVQIFNDSGTYCFGTNSKLTNEKAVDSKKGQVSIKVKADLVPGIYYITAATMNENATVVLDYKSKITSFRITKTTQLEGVAMLDYSWNIPSSN